MEQFQSLYDKVNRNCKDLPLVQSLELKTGLPAGIFVTVCVGIAAVLVFLGIAADFITEVVGMFYPIYMSFKALETKEPEDDKLWLTYWVAYAGFKVVDDFALLFSYWIPFYYPIKLIVLLWLFAPPTRGAVQVYNEFIRGLLLKHSKKIDSGIHVITNLSGNTFECGKEELSKGSGDPNSRKSF